MSANFLFTNSCITRTRPLKWTPSLSHYTFVLVPSLFTPLDILGDAANRNRMFTVKIIAGKVGELGAHTVIKTFPEEFELYLVYCR